MLADILGFTSNVFFWIVVIISNIFTMFWILSLLFHYNDIKNKSRPLKNYPSVVIAVPAYNEEKTIVKTLKSLMKLDYNKDKMRIIVVNDGSIDRTSEKIEEFIKKYGKNLKITFIDRKQNKGKGYSLNEALKKTREKFFVVLDADTYPSRNSLRKLVEKFYSEENQKIGAVVSNIKVYNKKNILEKFQRFEYIFTQMMRDLMYTLGLLYITPGAFTLYPTKLLKSVGGFDEKTVTEDFEIALRLKLKGYDIVFSKESIVRTKVPKTWKSYFNQRIRWNVGFIENSKKYFGKFFNSAQFSLFGHVFYPMTILSISILVVYSIMRLNMSIKDIIYKIQLIKYTGKIYLFDTSLKEWLLSLNLTVYMPLISIFLLSILLYRESFKHGNEKIKNFFVFFLYLLVYPIIAVFIWILSPIYYNLSYKKQERKRWLR